MLRTHLQGATKSHQQEAWVDCRDADLYPAALESPDYVLGGPYGYPAEHGPATQSGVTTGCRGMFGIHDQHLW